ncbi:MAG: dihydroorotate dehydrogenase electron transfer subunit [Oscillospiraceae bacterium]|nr:dihydroorotate dehydrogenase electron transfer subunit [Oscillospiraceae bacterium]
MKQSRFDIVSNSPVALNTFKMLLRGDCSGFTAPGQFINIRIDGFFLRRPISVYDFGDGCVSIVYRVAGRGTEALSRLSHGSLDLLLPLGNGFDVSKAGKHSLLLGGGVGSAPLHALAKALAGAGKRVTAVMGFNSAAEVFGEEELARAGAEVIICTLDGSRGEKGYVTGPMQGLDYDMFYACGPEPMLRAVEKTAVSDGQFSFEERMGCGFGACMGCSCETKYGAKRICRDGPVLNREEIIW